MVFIILTRSTKLSARRANDARLSAAIADMIRELVQEYMRIMGDYLVTDDTQSESAAVDITRVRSWKKRSRY